MSRLPVVGFTFLRNGVKYDYPFRATLASLAMLAEKTVLALGDSQDETAEEVNKLNLPLTIVPTIWDENDRKGGRILSQQTNLALKKAREIEARGWAFYLQCDEVIDEREVAKLHADLERAAAEGCDAVRFRYLHFWQSPDRLAVGKRWYPHEIRAVRLDSSLESYGDAQSFRSPQKIFESDCHIFHYGHVREPEAYVKKRNEFHRWWHSDAELPGKIAASQAGEKKESTIPYSGRHPRSIWSHLERAIPPRAWERPESLLIFGDCREFSDDFLSALPAKNVFWTKSAQDFLAAREVKKVAFDALPLLAQVLSGGQYFSRVPEAMAAKNARPWTKEFRARLILAERSLGFGEPMVWEKNEIHH